MTKDKINWQCYNFRLKLCIVLTNKGPGERTKRFNLKFFRFFILSLLYLYNVNYSESWFLIFFELFKEIGVSIFSLHKHDITILFSNRIKYRPVLYRPNFKWKYLENEKSFFENLKSGFHHFKNSFI